jgi:hypothetical protein
MQELFKEETKQGWKLFAEIRNPFISRDGRAFQKKHKCINNFNLYDLEKRISMS